MGGPRVTGGERGVRAGGKPGPQPRLLWKQPRDGPIPDTPTGVRGHHRTPIQHRWTGSTLPRRRANQIQEQYLKDDALVDRHLTKLYDTMLEKNLCRILEPFSTVEIDHVALLMELPLVVVEAKLSQMILDKKFRGILDQGAGHLIVYDDAQTGNASYGDALQVISSMNKVVDTLSRRAVHLN
jgi:hypothetical protein